MKLNGTTNITSLTRINNCLTIDGYNDGISLLVNGSTGYSPLVCIDGSSYYNYELYVNGETWSSLGYQGSDRIFKKNINSLKSNEMLNKLMRIEGKKYEFKTEDELKPEYLALSNLEQNDSIPIRIPRFPRGEYYGLIAQDIESEFPELVRIDSMTRTRALNYDGMIPILLEAIKEQQTIINSQELRIGNLEDKVNTLLENEEAKLKSVGINEETSENTILFQNIPNPFNQSTNIRFSMPEEINSAALYIYNMQGLQVESFDINERGLSSIEIEGSSLQPGIYLYTLVADGQEMDTKRMILTD